MNAMGFAVEAFEFEHAYNICKVQTSNIKIDLGPNPSV